MDEVGAYDIGIALLFLLLLMAFFSHSDKVGEDDHPVDPTPKAPDANRPRDDEDAP